MAQSDLSYPKHLNSFEDFLSTSQDWILSSLSAVTQVNNQWDSLTEQELHKWENIKRSLPYTKDIVKQCYEIFITVLPALNYFRTWCYQNREESNKKKNPTKSTMSHTCATFNKPLHIFPDNCKYFIHLFSLHTLCSDFRDRHHSLSLL